jgi:hypothetical protein
MIRVQAYIVGKTGNTYNVETLVEGNDAPYKFNILARDEDEAARTAIFRTEDMYAMAQTAVRNN